MERPRGLYESLQSDVLTWMGRRSRRANNPIAYWIGMVSTAFGLSSSVTTLTTPSRKSVRVISGLGMTWYGAAYLMTRRSKPRAGQKALLPGGQTAMDNRTVWVLEVGSSAVGAIAVRIAQLFCGHGVSGNRHVAYS